MRLVFSILLLIESSITAAPDFLDPEVTETDLGEWTSAKARNGKSTPEKSVVAVTSPTGIEEVFSSAGSETREFDFAPKTILQEQKYIPALDPVQEVDETAGEWELAKPRKGKSTAKRVVKVPEQLTTTTTSAPAEEERTKNSKKDRPESKKDRRSKRRDETTTTTTEAPEDDLIFEMDLPACRGIVERHAPVFEEQQRLYAPIQDVIDSMTRGMRVATFDHRPVPIIVAEAIATSLTKDELKLLILRIEEIVAEHHITKVFSVPALPQAHALVSAISKFYESAVFRKIAVTSTDTRKQAEAQSTCANHFTAASKLIRQVLYTEWYDGPIVF